MFSKAEVAVKIAYDRAGDIEEAAQMAQKEILNMGKNNTALNLVFEKDPKKNGPTAWMSHKIR